VKSTCQQSDWASANQRYLMMSVELVQAQLAAHFGLKKADVEGALEKLEAAKAEMPWPARLERLRELFLLSDFECSLVVLCAGIALDGTFAEFVAVLPHNSAETARATFSLGLAALPEAHWSAIGPAAPLRYWNLIVPAAADTVVRSPLHIDERILHFLTGVSAIDRRLEDILERVRPDSGLPPSHEMLAERLGEKWTAAGEDWPVLQLCGSDSAVHRLIAAAACRHLSLQLHALDARDLPTAARERQEWLRLWERESLLSDSALLIECGESAMQEAIRAAQKVRSAVFLSTREVVTLAPRASLRVDVPRPTHAEQHQMWMDALGEAAVSYNGEVDAVIAHFDLSNAAIAMTARLARAHSAPTSTGTGQKPLWELCRAQVGSHVGELAQRIEPRAQWHELILPSNQKNVLLTILAQVRQRSKVLELWGFAKSSSRGLGSTVLFAGPSGTGKTMAAEVLAGLLRLDLYRIDLSAVVSKYIGETEKNLRRVFDAAESGGAVLLFDEADALFGRRSEVKDSHDRYANIEVSYLLQRMEAYRGLAILTTNLKQSLDAAFVRRLRFIVQFPFPDIVQREQIWATVFPRETPREGLDCGKLARLSVAGGNIRNIALNAAFLAADASQPVRMEHLLVAAHAEAAKLERPIMETEVAGWT
jgi:ATPase family associated with various cellular activities (AAA)/Winged helix domain, variant